MVLAPPPSAFHAANAANNAANSAPADSITARQRAEAAQIAASDPAVSAFVSASAGSGKTKLLTDRLLRLMLAGANPGAIQCLTFTKAAAAEMALRLQARLGNWVTMDDDALDRELAALQRAPDQASRDQARALFATVLDLPGGMRISTIHAFCQSLLGRFPLEAQLTPNFQLAEESDSILALEQAREEILGNLPDDMTGHATGDLKSNVNRVAAFAALRDLTAIFGALNKKSELLETIFALPAPTLWAALRRSLKIEANDEATLLAQAADALRTDDGLRTALRTIASDGSEKVRERAMTMLDFLALPSATQITRWDEWRICFLTQKGEARAPGALCNDKLAKERPALRDALAAAQQQILTLDDHLRRPESPGLETAGRPRRGLGAV
jgi:ATP-dependent helicase/nuclease subunit A